ncbi:asparagine synthase (glutamine-hydrolyzing) [Devosia psychrophila]|uniref:asparagine synthase (glutamine-hydrolyzing) n=1 Tax=Devosia psychrophila TaxID=728005 RepID=A0A0F5Q3D0_9HYPH|nr:asparagine synthase (glutamine-hydrolyzing) [Devosia psychrophila]KKC34564.1 hypothetical protein WH91_02210 [Devosia psychrophila]SFD35109.1 asparagine synthase (glutamine-hydrolysing) [Devosia psychrophila]
MCGIAGLVSWNGASDRAVVQRMTDALAHRGPDGAGVASLTHAVFGHRRLAIRDLSEDGHQPMFDQAGDVMVTFNGEIYNDEALRRQIEQESGYRFKSRCDTEILPIGWKLWGESLFARLEGMFAIALWDRTANTLVLARDPIGIKPLYYAQSGDAVLFSSELKGILVSGRLPGAIDPLAFHTYLATGYPDPDQSLVAGVKQLLPGTYRVVTERDAWTETYWRPARPSRIVDGQQALDQLADVLSATCEKLLVSDVPVGLMLSSGIDSGILSMLVPGANIPAFTARFSDATFDEGAGAQVLASQGGHPWHPLVVDRQFDIEADFRAVALAVDGELADSSALAHYMICRSIRGHVTVALAGDGADEFFGGYDTYAATLLASYLGGPLTRGPAGLAGELFAKMSATHEGRTGPLQFLSRFGAGLAAPEGAHHAEWRRLAPRSLLDRLYGDALAPMLRLDPLAGYRAAYRDAPGAVLDKALLSDQTYYLPGDMLAKVDRMSMAHGLEIRVPFLERPVMELAGDISVDLLVSAAGKKKAILRDLAAALGIKSDLVKQKKRGFNVPVARMLRTDLVLLARRFFEADADIFSPLLKPDAVRGIWKEHEARKANHGYVLWALLIHAVWREAHPS